MPDHTWRHKLVNEENQKRKAEGKEPFPEYKGTKKDVPKTPKIDPRDVAPEVGHQQEVDKRQAVQDADMNEGNYLQMSDKDIEELTVKQNQQRDSRLYGEFDDLVEAARKARGREKKSLLQRAGRVREQIETGKDPMTIGEIPGAAWNTAMNYAETMATDPQAMSEHMLELGLDARAFASGAAKGGLTGAFVDGPLPFGETAGALIGGVSNVVRQRILRRIAGEAVDIADGINWKIFHSKQGDLIPAEGIIPIDDTRQYVKDTINKNWYESRGIKGSKNPNQLGMDFKSADLSKYQKDMRNPYISQPVRMDLAHSMRGTAFRTSEPFDYRKFIDIPTKSMPAQGREFLQYFQAGLTKGGASKAESFAHAQRTLTPSLIDEYNLTNLSKSSFQVHHKAALKSIMGIFDGLDFDSPVFREVSAVMLEEMPGIGLGNQANNLRGIIGSVADKGTPHNLVHKYYNKILGKKGDGRDFFTDEVLERMKVDKQFRLDKAKELARIIVNSEEVVEQATKLWKLGFSNKERFKNFDDLVNHLSKFDELGYNSLSKPKYEAGVFTDIITQIATDPSMLPPVQKSQRGTWIRKNLERKQELELDEISTDASLKNKRRKRKNPQGEIPGL